MFSAASVGGSKQSTYRSGGGHKYSQTRKKGKRSLATQRPYVIKGITYYPIPSARGYVEEGIASWYGEPFYTVVAPPTARSTICTATRAAHKTLPMNTMLLVKNLDNGRSTVVRINDRGPFVQDRIIDLTYTKAENPGGSRKGGRQGWKSSPWRKASQHPRRREP